MSRTHISYDYRTFSVLCNVVDCSTVDIMEEAAIPVIDPLVLEEESAIVSETDGAPHSSDDEAGLKNLDWLSSTHIRNHPSSTTAAAAAACTPNHDDDEDENDSVDENEMKEIAGPEDFYCSNMDDEDEAYVYKHLRSGREETVHVRRAYQQRQNEEQQRDNSTLLNETSTEKSSDQNTSNFESTSNDTNCTNGEEEEEQELPLSTSTTQMNNPQSNNMLHQARLLKPRNSDAILSCPRCFNVVCMDCQQHERYSNQYRAMFVMNIGVDWTKKMMYDDAIGGLKAYTTNGGNGGRTLGGIMEGEEEDASMPDRIPHDDILQSSNTTEPEKEAYYSVHCSYCRLELAALDMGDEIYYFFGCIASS